MWIGIAVVSFTVLKYSADYFLEYSEKIGVVLRMPEFITGVLIIAIGTSAPEVAISISAIYNGEGHMIIGNLYGTIIANIFLGFGVAVLFAKTVFEIKWDLFNTDIPIFFIASALSLLLIMDGELSFFDSIVMLLGMTIYFIHMYLLNKKHQAESEIVEGVDKNKIWLYLILAVVSLGVLILSSDYAIKAIIEIAILAGLDNSALAASIVAVGTSLPEIAVAIGSAIKGKYEMVAGNIIGSNVFDIFAILGLGGLITNISIDTISSSVTIPFYFATLVVFFITFKDHKIHKVDSFFMLLIYAVFIGKLYGWF